jgi:hypothetical protein
MKQGELKKVAHGYSAFFQSPWREASAEFLRHEADWVQIVSFNASRFSNQYVPRSSMEFLKMPGVPTGSILVQELRNPNESQRWVNLRDPPANIFPEMLKQFKPPISDPINRSEILDLLAMSLDYWPNSYVLSIVACEEGNISQAQRYFDAFISATANKPYSWVETRKQELLECFSLAKSPEQFKTRLKGIMAEKLRALKLPA